VSDTLSSFEPSVLPREQGADPLKERRRSLSIGTRGATFFQRRTREGGNDKEKSRGERPSVD
jgi:hypothetical protein